MSSGLVASMGMSAQAVGRNAAGELAAAPATAPIAVQPAAAFQSGLMAAPATLQTSAPALTAPAAATVKFESDAFKAVPKIVAPTLTAGQSTVSSGVASAFGSARGSSVLAVAARYVGVNYLYGGTNPGTGFDCSGATQYIFRQLGIAIPRTANDQMLSSTRIPRSTAQVGDLVFFLSGGRAYHVGIYAGGNMMYDAPRTGKKFSKRAIWSSSVIFGRVTA
jgi:cell wall-associated NlpC family hydrolase